MKFDIDYIAHNNELSLTNKFYKLFFASFSMILALCLNNIYLDALIFMIMSIIILLIAKISLKSYLKFIAIPFIFTVIATIYLILFTGGGDVVYRLGFFGIIITKDSLNLGILTFARVFACFSCLGFLTLTTPIADILHCLSVFKVPKIIIEIALLMYNSIFIFLKQLNTMRNAQETRLGYNGTKATYRSLGSLFSILFLKSLDKSEKLQYALDSRCYTGKMPIYDLNNSNQINGEIYND